MTDKEMVLDALNAVKHEIVDLTRAAEEASNANVRDTFLNFRNRAEQVQTQLVQIATQNGWYIPSPPVNDTEIAQIKQQLTGAGATATIHV